MWWQQTFNLSMELCSSSCISAKQTFWLTTNKNTGSSTTKYQLSGTQLWHQMLIGNLTMIVRMCWSVPEMAHFEQLMPWGVELPLQQPVGFKSRRVAFLFGNLTYAWVWPFLCACVPLWVSPLLTPLTRQDFYTLPLWSCHILETNCNIYCASLHL